MKVIVTGGAGFIGSHVIDHLIASGVPPSSIVSVDDLSYGSIENLPAEVHNYAMTVEEFFSRPPDGLRHADYPEIRTIFHFAGRVGVEAVLKAPLEILREQTEDMELVCRFASKHGARLCAVSSSEVYGASTDVPFRENASLLVPPSERARAVYAIGKLATEHIALHHHRTSGLRVVVARLFNVVGPRQRVREGCFLPRLVVAMLRGETFYLHGGGHQIRCFTHVEMVARALIELAGTPEAYGEVVNVGADAETTIWRAASDVYRYCAATYGITAGTMATVPFDRLPSDAAWDLMLTRVPDLTKLRTLLGWAPGDTWEAIIRDTCRYWHERLRREDDGRDSREERTAAAE